MGIKKGLFRLSLILLTVVLITGGILPSLGVAAANVVKIEKTYDIVVAYDNSASMYDGVDSWCKAKFAMEIFASMMDFKNGDKLTIFPMWEVVTDGSTPAAAANSVENDDPIEIRSVQDINKITNMYTLKPGSTPISVVDKAAKYLMKSNATEKWLLVLTDGAFNGDPDNMKYNDQEVLKRSNALVLTPERTQEILLGYAGKGMNVQYFLMGETLTYAKLVDGKTVVDYQMGVVKADTKKGLYSDQAKTSDALQEKIIGICNKIFQRDELKDSLFGKSLTLDISMKNLIVFVQGQGAKINSLTDESGNPIQSISDSLQRKFSTYSWPGPYNEKTDIYGTDYTPKIDDTLYGQVVTYGECGVGNYTLDISGADKDKIKIFYEPDVDMEVTVTTPDGAPVDIEKGSILGGDYVIKAKLVDAKTGKDITKSPLLGGNVKFEIKITEDGKTPRIENLDVEKGSTVKFTPGKDIDTVVTGTYLKDYKISSEDDSSIFPNTIDVIDPEDGLAIKAEVLQNDEWFQLSKHKEWKPIKVDLTIDGKPLTDDQLNAAAFDFKAELGGDAKKAEALVYKVEPIKGESAVNVYLAKNEDGKYKEPATGKYELTIVAGVVANTGETLYANDTVKFQIQILSTFVLNLIIILSILAIILLIILYLSQKVLPNNIILETTVYTKEGMKTNGVKAMIKYHKSYGKKKGELTVSTPRSISGPTACSATFKLVAIDRRFVKSCDRQMRIVEINSNASTVLVDNNKFVKKNGKFTEHAGGGDSALQFDTNISMVEIKTDMANLKCTLSTK